MPKPPMRKQVGYLKRLFSEPQPVLDELRREYGPVVGLGRSILLHVMVRSLLGDRMAGKADEFGALFQRPQDYLEAPAFKQAPHRLPFTARSRGVSSIESSMARSRSRAPTWRANPPRSCRRWCATRRCRTPRCAIN